MFLFVCQLIGSSCYHIPVVNLEIGNGDTSCISLIIQDCSKYPCFFVSPYEAENCLFNICEELCQNFEGNCVESVDFF